MTVPRKLFLGFGALAIAAITSGIVAYRGNARVRDDMRTLRTEHVRQLFLAGQISTALAKTVADEQNKLDHDRVDEFLHDAVHPQTHTLDAVHALQ